MEPDCGFCMLGECHLICLCLIKMINTDIKSILVHVLIKLCFGWAVIKSHDLLMQISIFPSGLSDSEVIHFI